MKKTALLLALVSQLLMPRLMLGGITYHDTTGLTFYARIQTGASTFKAIALTEGSSGGASVYTLADSAIVSAGVTVPSGQNGFAYTIRSGSASDTANDAIVGQGTIVWDGSCEHGARDFVYEHNGTAATSATAVETIVEAASAHSRFRVGPGYYDFSTAKITMPDDVSLRGTGVEQTTLAFSTAGVAILPGDRSVLSDFSFIAADSGTQGVGSSSTEQFVNALIERVWFDNSGGHSIGLMASSNACSLTFDDCTARCNDDVITAINAAHKLTCRDTWFNGIDDGFGLASATDNIRMENCSLVQRSTGGSSEVINISGAMELSNCRVVPTGGHAPMLINLGATVVTAGCEFNRGAVTNNAGASAWVDAFSPLRPTTFARTLDVSSAGNAGIDWANIASPTTTVGLTGTTVDLEAGAVDTTSVATGAIDADAVATSAAEEIGAESGAAAEVSPFLIAKNHSWRFDNPNQVTAPNIITENAEADDVLIEMDFSGVLHANASISTIDATTVTNITGTEPTIASSAKRADSKAAHLTMDFAGATAQTYTVNVTITTTDGQTFVRKGRLTVN